MFGLLIGKMTPDIKLSQEDAERAQQVMSSLSPETIDRLVIKHYLYIHAFIVSRFLDFGFCLIKDVVGLLQIKLADRIKTACEGAVKTKNWLLGRQGFLMVVFMLLFAIFLHWLGFIGN